MKSMKLGIAVVGAIVAFCAAPQAVHSQSYPNRPIRMLVAYQAGGGSDLTARIIAAKLEEALGEAVVVDNRPGALGMIGTAAAARSAPDGYTLLMGGANAFVVNPAVRSKISYDPVNDFIPISLVVELPMAIAVGRLVPVNSMQELIEHLKANPGKVDFASSTDMSRLAGAMLGQQTSTQLTRIPYKGSTDATQAVVMGSVAMTIGEVGSMRPYFQSGAMRGLAVTTSRRAAALPDLPTVAEAANLPDFDFGTWFGVFAPKGTPEPIVTRLHTEINRIVKLPEVHDKLIKTIGGNPIPGTSAEFAERIRRELASYRSVAAADNMKED